MPSLAAVRGFENPPARSLILIPVFPWAEAQFPHRCVNDPGIRRINLHIGSADVLAFRKHLLPILPAVGRKIDSPLFIRTIGMSQHRGENAVRIMRIDSKSGYSLAVAEPGKMRPRLARIA